MARKDQTKETSIVAPVAIPSVAARATEREITRAPEFVSLYANDIQIQTSPWDMRLTFGEMGDVAPPLMNIKQIGELRISLPLAKKLTMIMFEQLKSYEAQVGEIPLPKD